MAEFLQSTSSSAKPRAQFLRLHRQRLHSRPLALLLWLRLIPGAGHVPHRGVRKCLLMGIAAGLLIISLLRRESLPESGRESSVIPSSAPAGPFGEGLPFSREPNLSLTRLLRLFLPDRGTDVYGRSFRHQGIMGRVCHFLS